MYKASLTSPCDLEHCCANDNRNLCFLMHTTVAYNQDRICDVSSQLLQSNLKHYFQSTHGHETDPEVIAENFIKWHQTICLPARRVTEVATQFCNDTSNCVNTYFGTHSCLRPYSSHPLIRLIVIEVESKQTNILFWGPAAELYQAVNLSALKPRFGFVPIMAHEQLNIFYRYSAIEYYAFMFATFVSMCSLFYLFPGISSQYHLVSFYSICYHTIHLMVITYSL